MGDLEAEMDLPLPRLIDVTLDPRIHVDLAALEQQLGAAVEGATVGAEVSARDRAERLAAFLRAWGIAGGVAALIVMLALVGLITLASLRMIAGSVELLRCMGAPDRYLARQFEGHALLSSLQGGLVGFVLALLTVLAVLHSGDRMHLADAFEPQLPAMDWLLLACVPLLAALPIMAVARLTALWALMRSP
jgi:cell division transport system permease protein